MRREQSEKNAAASMIAAAASAQSAAGAMAKAQTSETNAKASENRCEDIFERLGTVIKIKGRVDTFEELPTTGNLDGDAYLVGVAGLTSYPEYYWFSDHWEYLGTSTDKIEWGTLQGNIAKQADLQQALDEKANNSNVTAELAKKQNNLSAAQLEACNSGITAAKVGTYDGYAAQIASKANVGLDNIPANIDYVIESKFPTNNNPSWYRVYKSGWIEQGGEFTNTNTVFTVNLIKTMQNSHYSVSVTLGEENKNSNYSIIVGARTVTSFSGAMSSAHITYPSLWRVCGY